VIFSFELLSQKVVLVDDFLSKFEQGITIIFQLVKLILQKLDFILIGHQQWFDVVQLLKVVLSVDYVDVFNGLGLAHWEACLFAHSSEVFG
jgi:hypothetical protein